MANIKSAQKRILVSERNRQRNLAVKSKLKTLVKKSRDAITKKTENSLEVVKLASIALDKAASKGIIHRKQAARRKGRLMQQATKK